MSDVGDLAAIVTEIDSRLTTRRVDDQGQEALLQDRDRATLYLAAVRAGRRELIRHDLYYDLLERYLAHAAGGRDGDAID